MVATILNIEAIKKDFLNFQMF